MTSEDPLREARAFVWWLPVCIAGWTALLLMVGLA